MPETVEVPLNDGQVALIDAEDLPLVSAYRWHVVKFKRTSTTYARAWIMHPDGSRTALRMHRLITGAKPGQSVDHENHDGLDNRRANLRIANQTQNNGNMRLRSTSRSGYKGVSWHGARGRWRAEIQANGQRKWLGLFDDPWDAAQAYNAAALEIFGEFAHLNERQEDR